MEESSSSLEEGMDRVAELFDISEMEFDNPEELIMKTTTDEEDNISRKTEPPPSSQEGEEVISDVVIKTEQVEEDNTDDPRVQGTSPPTPPPVLTPQNVKTEPRPEVSEDLSPPHLEPEPVIINGNEGGDGGGDGGVTPTESNSESESESECYIKTDDEEAEEHRKEDEEDSMEMTDEGEGTGTMTFSSPYAYPEMGQEQDSPPRVEQHQEEMEYQERSAEVQGSITTAEYGGVVVGVERDMNFPSAENQSTDLNHSIAKCQNQVQNEDKSVPVAESERIDADSNDNENDKTDLPTKQGYCLPPPPVLLIKKEQDDPPPESEPEDEDTQQHQYKETNDNEEFRTETEELPIRQKEVVEGLMRLSNIKEENMEGGEEGLNFNEIIGEEDQDEDPASNLVRVPGEIENDEDTLPLPSPPPRGLVRLNVESQEQERIEICEEQSSPPTPDAEVPSENGVELNTEMDPTTPSPPPPPQKGSRTGLKPGARRSQPVKVQKFITIRRFYCTICWAEVGSPYGLAKHLDKQHNIRVVKGSARIVDADERDEKRDNERLSKLLQEVENKPREVDPFSSSSSSESEKENEDGGDSSENDGGPRRSRRSRTLTSSSPNKREGSPSACPDSSSLLSSSEEEDEEDNGITGFEGSPTVLSQDEEYAKLRAKEMTKLQKKDSWARKCNEDLGDKKISSSYSQCEDCFMELPTHPHFFAMQMDHERLHKEGIYKKCKYCAMSFLYEHQLNVHLEGMNVPMVPEGMWSLEAEDLLYPSNQCTREDCRKIFPNRKCYLFHLTTHDRVHRCQICEKPFARYAVLLKHIEKNHNWEKRVFSCDVNGCDKMYDSYQKLRMHQVHSHERKAAKANLDKENGDIGKEGNGRNSKVLTLWRQKVLEKQKRKKYKALMTGSKGKITTPRRSTSLQFQPQNFNNDGMDITALTPRSTAEDDDKQEEVVHRMTKTQLRYNIHGPSSHANTLSLAPRKGISATDKKRNIAYVRTFSFPCICNRFFRAVEPRDIHMKTVHGIDKTIRKPFLCKVPGCEKACANLQKYTGHMQSHPIEIQEEVFQEAIKEDFEHTGGKNELVGEVAEQGDQEDQDLEITDDDDDQEPESESSPKPAKLPRQNSISGVKPKIRPTPSAIRVLDNFKMKGGWYCPECPIEKRKGYYSVWNVHRHLSNTHPDSKFIKNPDTLNHDEIVKSVANVRDVNVKIPVLELSSLKSVNQDQEDVPVPDAPLPSSPAPQPPADPVAGPSSSSGILINKLDQKKVGLVDDDLLTKDSDSYILMLHRSFLASKFYLGRRSDGKLIPCVCPLCPVDEEGERTVSSIQNLQLHLFNYHPDCDLLRKSKLDLESVQPLRRGRKGSKRSKVKNKDDLLTKTSDPRLLSKHRSYLLSKFRVGTARNRQGVCACPFCPRKQGGGQRLFSSPSSLQYHLLAFHPECDLLRQSKLNLESVKQYQKPKKGDSAKIKTMRTGGEKVENIDGQEGVESEEEEELPNPPDARPSGVERELQEQGPSGDDLLTKYSSQRTLRLHRAFLTSKFAVPRRTLSKSRHIPCACPVCPVREGGEKRILFNGLNLQNHLFAFHPECAFLRKSKLNLEPVQLPVDKRRWGFTKKLKLKKLKNQNESIKNKNAHQCKDKEGDFLTKDSEPDRGGGVEEDVNMESEEELPNPPVPGPSGVGRKSEEHDQGPLRDDLLNKDSDPYTLTLHRSFLASKFAVPRRANSISRAIACACPMCPVGEGGKKLICISSQTLQRHLFSYHPECDLLRESKLNLESMELPIEYRRMCPWRKKLKIRNGRMKKKNQIKDKEGDFVTKDSDPNLGGGAEGEDVNMESEEEDEEELPNPPVPGPSGVGRKSEEHDQGPLRDDLLNKDSDPYTLTVHRSFLASKLAVPRGTTRTVSGSIACACPLCPVGEGGEKLSLVSSRALQRHLFKYHPECDLLRESKLNLESVELPIQYRRMCPWRRQVKIRNGRRKNNNNSHQVKDKDKEEGDFLTKDSDPALLTRHRRYLTSKYRVARRPSSNNKAAVPCACPVCPVEETGKKRVLASSRNLQFHLFTYHQECDMLSKSKLNLESIELPKPRGRRKGWRRKLKIRNGRMMKKKNAHQVKEKIVVPQDDKDKEYDFLTKDSDPDLQRLHRKYLTSEYKVTTVGTHTMCECPLCPSTNGEEGGGNRLFWGSRALQSHLFSVHPQCEILRISKLNLESLERYKKPKEMNRRRNTTADEVEGGGGGDEEESVGEESDMNMEPESVSEEEELPNPYSVPNEIPNDPEDVSEEEELPNPPDPSGVGMELQQQEQGPVGDDLLTKDSDPYILTLHRAFLTSKFRAGPTTKSRQIPCACPLCPAGEGGKRRILSSNRSLQFHMFAYHAGSDLLSKSKLNLESMELPVDRRTRKWKIRNGSLKKNQDHQDEEGDFLTKDSDPDLLSLHQSYLTSKYRVGTIGSNTICCECPLCPGEGGGKLLFTGTKSLQSHIFSVHPQCEILRISELNLESIQRYKKPKEWGSGRNGDKSEEGGDSGDEEESVGGEEGELDMNMAAEPEGVSEEEESRTTSESSDYVHVPNEIKKWERRRGPKQGAQKRQLSLSSILQKAYKVDTGGFKCPVCDPTRIFTLVQNLAVHVKKAHPTCEFLMTVEKILALAGQKQGPVEGEEESMDIPEAGGAPPTPYDESEDSSHIETEEKDAEIIMEESYSKPGIFLPEPEEPLDSLKAKIRPLSSYGLDEFGRRRKKRKVRGKKFKTSDSTCAEYGDKGEDDETQRQEGPGPSNSVDPQEEEQDKSQEQEQEQSAVKGEDGNEQLVEDPEVESQSQPPPPKKLKPWTLLHYLQYFSLPSKRAFCPACPYPWDGKGDYRKYPFSRDCLGLGVQRHWRFKHKDTIGKDKSPELQERLADWKCPHLGCEEKRHENVEELIHHLKTEHKGKVPDGEVDVNLEEVTPDSMSSSEEEVKEKDGTTTSSRSSRKTRRSSLPFHYKEPSDEEVDGEFHHHQTTVPLPRVQKRSSFITPGDEVDHFPCPDCPKVFISWEKLRSHSGWHTREGRRRRKMGGNTVVIGGEEKEDEDMEEVDPEEMMREIELEALKNINNLPEVAVRLERLGVREEGTNLRSASPKSEGIGQQEWVGGVDNDMKLKNEPKEEDFSPPCPTLSPQGVPIIHDPASNNEMEVIDHLDMKPEPPPPSLSAEEMF